MPRRPANERIISAAIALRNERCCVPGHSSGDFDLIVSVPAPARHHHCLYMVHRQGVESHAWEQGFLTSSGRFVDREEAWCIAEKAGQIIKQSGPKGTLFSEDLW